MFVFFFRVAALTIHHPHPSTYVRTHARTPNTHTRGLRTRRCWGAGAPAAARSHAAPCWGCPRPPSPGGCAGGWARINRGGGGMGGSQGPFVDGCGAVIEPRLLDRMCNAGKRPPPSIPKCPTQASRTLSATMPLVCLSRALYTTP